MNCGLFDFWHHKHFNVKRHKGAFKYHVSAFGGGAGLNKNADTADAGEGGWGISDKMWTLLTLGSSGVGNQKKLIEIITKLIEFFLNPALFASQRDQVPQKC